MSVNPSDNKPDNSFARGANPEETQQIDGEQILEAPPPITSVPPTMQPGSIAFYIPGNDNPILFHDRSSVVIGRKTPESPDIDLDLSNNQGIELGVSRRHTIIEWNGKDFFITDLNSSNGTFLNERRLRPNTPELVRRGDQVRVGQLLMVVYITPQNSMLDKDVILYVVDVNRPRAGSPPMRAMSPVFLQVVASYVQTLAELQRTVMRASDKPAQHFTITNLTLTETHLELVLSGVTEALPPICKLLASLQPVSTMSDTPASPSSTINILNDPKDPLTTRQTFATIEFAAHQSTESSDENAGASELHVQLAQRLVSDLGISLMPQSSLLQDMSVFLHRLLDIPIGLSLVPPN